MGTTQRPNRDGARSHARARPVLRPSNHRHFSAGVPTGRSTRAAARFFFFWRRRDEESATSTLTGALARVARRGAAPRRSFRARHRRRTPSTHPPNTTTSARRFPEALEHRPDEQRLAGRVDVMRATPDRRARRRSPQRREQPDRRERHVAFHPRAGTGPCPARATSANATCSPPSSPATRHRSAERRHSGAAPARRAPRRGCPVYPVAPNGPMRPLIARTLQRPDDARPGTSQP